MVKWCDDCTHVDRTPGQYPCKECVASMNKTPYWVAKIDPPKPKGIDIVMVCGEKLHVDTVQLEIAKIMLHGEQVYPTTDRKNSKIVVGSWTIHFLETSILLTHDGGNNSYEFVHDCAGWVNTGKNRSTLYDDDLQPETVEYLKDNK